MTTVPYTRRADYRDLPRPTQLGILHYELEIGSTDEERKEALKSIESLEKVIQKIDVKVEAPIGGMIANPTHDLYNQ